MSTCTAQSDSMSITTCSLCLGKIKKIKRGGGVRMRGRIMLGRGWVDGD